MQVVRSCGHWSAGQLATEASIHTGRTNNYRRAILHYTIYMIKLCLQPAVQINELRTDLKMSKSQYVEGSLCGGFNMSKSQYVKVTICRSHNMSKSQYVDVTICRRFNISNPLEITRLLRFGRFIAM